MSVSPGGQKGKQDKAQAGQGYRKAGPRDFSQSPWQLIILGRTHGEQCTVDPSDFLSSDSIKKENIYLLICIFLSKLPSSIQFSLYGTASTPPIFKWGNLVFFLPTSSHVQHLARCLISRPCWFLIRPLTDTGNVGEDKISLLYCQIAERNRSAEFPKGHTQYISGEKEYFDPRWSSGWRTPSSALVSRLGRTQRGILPSLTRFLHAQPGFPQGWGGMRMWNQAEGTQHREKVPHQTTVGCVP